MSLPDIVVIREDFNLTVTHLDDLLDPDNAYFEQLV